MTYTYNGTNCGYSTDTNGRVSQVTYAGPHGTSYVEMYSYHNAGGVTQRLSNSAALFSGSNPINMDAGYNFDNEGHVTSSAYPFAQVNSNATTTAGPAYNYTYDSMGRLNQMSDQANTNWVSGVTYGPGLLDTDIQAALGITVNSKNTGNITTTLQKDCITGKGNN